MTGTVRPLRRSEVRDPFAVWRPALLSHKLKTKPAEIKLFGREIVLFRGSDGRVYALNNRCPHRKMRLSQGHVDGCQIVCPYHGWRFSGEGAGVSPGTPGMKVSTESYEASEGHGVVWLRESGGTDEIPSFDFPGYRHAALLYHPLHAPLRHLLDNMMELEHTASVHSLFGFDVSRLHEVTTSTTQKEDGIHIFYDGPQRKLPLYLRATSGIREGDRFIQYADVKLAPIHAVYDLQWRDPKQNSLRGMELKFVIYFNEIEPDRAEQFTFAYFRCDGPLRQNLFTLLRKVLAFNINRELTADVKLVESLHLTQQHENSYLFGRFDKPLHMMRRMTTQFPEARTEADDKEQPGVNSR